MHSISSYVGEVPPAVYEQGMPMEQHDIANRFAIGAEEVCHEFGRTRLGGISAAVVGLDPRCFATDDCTLARSRISPSMAELSTASCAMSWMERF